MYKRGQQKLKRRKRTSAKSSFDENKEINVVVKSGKYRLGVRTVQRELSMGDLKLIILARNAPHDVVDQITLLNNCLDSPVPIHITNNSSWDLGAVVGKPFWVSIIGVIEEGDSSILKVVEQKESL
ncbi:MAG: 50S ribosomal protein L30e [Promethearchaeota archaeon]